MRRQPRIRACTAQNSSSDRKPLLLHGSLMPLQNATSTVQLKLATSISRVLPAALPRHHTRAHPMRTQEPSAASCGGCSTDCSEPAAQEPLGHGCMLDRRLLLAAADAAGPPKPAEASTGAPTVLLQLVAASSAACSAAVTLSKGEAGGKLLAQP